jgi:hypothetical protein
MGKRHRFYLKGSDMLVPAWHRNRVANMLPHPHPIHTNIAQHGHVGKNFTCPIPTTTGKQPKPKTQTSSQPKDGMGQLCKHPSPQRKKPQLLIG